MSSSYGKLLPLSMAPRVAALTSRDPIQSYSKMRGSLFRLPAFPANGLPFIDPYTSQILIIENFYDILGYKNIQTQTLISFQ
jgi:hypothetical protein